uniref:Uncharacterized protein n=1 Tax=Myoviridae sp. ctCo31 TaxID=2825053 RepID=A0A8S5UM04_9CAUD|nr:MAG TPA: hypothetical protein [Myoviridae sp. ctCo31]
MLLLLLVFSKLFLNVFRHSGNNSRFFGVCFS